MKSENINELAAALSKAQGQFDHAKKDVANAFFKSKYADLASCIDAAKTALAANGLAVVQSTDFDNDRLVLITTLMHSSGQWIDSKYPIQPVKNDPQGMGSAMTYSRRYAFCAITGIAADDDDGNAASGKASLNADQVADFTAQIQSASDLQNLLAIWQTVPKAFHKDLVKVKDSMKVKLQEAA